MSKKNRLTADELNLLTATLQFVHLNRMAFGTYVRSQGHGNLADDLENNDHNILRRKLSSMYEAILDREDRWV